MFNLKHFATGDMALSEKASFKVKTWYWILLSLMCLFVVSQLHQVRSTIIRFDVASAQWLNHFLGYSPVFDLSLAVINSKTGDKLVVVLISLLLLNHIWRTPDRRELYRRLAFWTWVVLLFAVVYNCQQSIEELVRRESPSKVLADWQNLKEMYGVTVKVSNRNSFPSGHAAAYFFFAFMALRQYPAMGYLFLTLALTLPATRIMTGAHWLTDIYLGSVPLALLGSAIAYETRVYRIWIYLELSYEECGSKVHDFVTRIRNAS